MKNSLLALVLLTAAAGADASVVALTLESHYFGRNGPPSSSKINPAPSFVGDFGNIPVPTYWYDTDTGELSSSGVTHLRISTGPGQFSRHFDRLITDLNIVGGSAAGSTAYECISGGFGDMVSANMCGNYLFGDDGVDDSSISYSGLGWTRTMGGDDVIAGNPQTILDYNLMVASWDGVHLALESPEWTAAGGTAGLQMNFAIVPVPAAVWLFGSALGLLGWIRRRVAA
ncbi:MAG: VPLPA-CTERM sorting domain-containing protein [Gammaproteobacteria bacterium]|nr:MAG: VPLPA-CTERM sorting domain-containing protein [Gammaproteobacteria bacterium]